jgi:hypothetical protein
VGWAAVRELGFIFSPLAVIECMAYQDALPTWAAFAMLSGKRHAAARNPENKSVERKLTMRFLSPSISGGELSEPVA